MQLIVFTRFPRLPNEIGKRIDCMLNHMGAFPMNNEHFHASRRRTFLIAILAIMFGLLLLLPRRIVNAQAQSPGATTYTVTDLGTLPTHTVNCQANGVNNSGEVIGNCSNGFYPQGFVWTMGMGIVDIGLLPGSSYTFPTGINNSGQVTGIADYNPSEIPFIYDNGTLHSVGLPAGASDAQGSAINDSGELLVTADTTRQYYYGDVYTYAGGSFTLLGLAWFSRGTGINALGQAAGFQSINEDSGDTGFFWNAGSVTLIEPPPLGSDAYALGVNNNGQVVGYSDTSSGTHVITWTSGTGTQDLGLFPGDPGTIGEAINTLGQIVGFSIDNHANPDRAVLYQPGTGFIDLNASIPNDSGWTLQSANAINDNGQIVGGGVHNGKNRAFLLTPQGFNTEFLSFPLLNKMQSTAAINTVFDHSAQYQYCSDGTVTAYTGEQGSNVFSSMYGASFVCHLTNMMNTLYGFQQQSGERFNINGHYQGAGQPTYLFYEGHPGYDYRTTDQMLDGTLCPHESRCNPSGKTQVVAAASGIVACENPPPMGMKACTEGPGEIKINHNNGYFTIYLHLSHFNVQPGADVTTGQTIGISGQTGAPGNPHLHFEVRIGTVPVDPYGWLGQGPDPYNRATNVLLWK